MPESKRKTPLWNLKPPVTFFAELPPANLKAASSLDARKSEQAEKDVTTTRSPTPVPQLNVARLVFVLEVSIPLLPSFNTFPSAPAAVPSATSKYSASVLVSPASEPMVSSS